MDINKNEWDSFSFNEKNIEDIKKRLTLTERDAIEGIGISEEEMDRFFDSLT